MAAYEGLARMHLYRGDVEKVRFYDARVTSGIYEPDTTQGYKIHVAQTIIDHPWLKPKRKMEGELNQPAGHELLWKQC